MTKQETIRYKAIPYPCTNLHFLSAIPEKVNTKILIRTTLIEPLNALSETLVLTVDLKDEVTYYQDKSISKFNSRFDSEYHFVQEKVDDIIVSLIYQETGVMVEYANWEEIEEF